MENKLYQDEFEQFLQDEVKQHRMYPSDHIWKNIRTDLHGYKAWPALTFISLFIITALTISTLLSNHPQHMPVVRTAITALVPEQAAPVAAVSKTNGPVANYFGRIAGEQLTAETIAALNTSEPADEQIITVSHPQEAALQPIASAQLHTDRKPAGRLAAGEPSISNIQPVTNTFVAADQPATEEKMNTTVAAMPVAEQPAEEKTTVTPTRKADTHATADDYLKDFGYTVTSTPRRNPRFGFQFYVTPSTSYRRLSDEKVKEVIQPAAAARTPVPLSAVNADVNEVVRHKPAVGLEMGFALLYTMSPRVKFKTGVQLNVRQYYIETFQSLTNDLATLSLINFSGVETISFYSPYNNNTGYRATQLDNKVYQLSVPVGIEWAAIQGKHFGVSTEASVQPTMTLNNNTYLLSTDYKHYTAGDPFIRKWNINTSVGLNLTYKVGTSAWQIGPQIRYQHLPTYSNAYPIREFLMDYGVRLAFTKQLK